MDYYCALKGNLGTGSTADIFQHSLAVVSSASPETLAAAIAAAWDDNWADPDGGIGHYFPPGVIYDEVSVAAILDRGPANPTLGTAYHHLIVPALAGSEGAGMPLPTQIAIAVSVWGGVKPNGAPIKGRFYLPSPVHTTLQSFGLLTTAAQTEITQNMSGFLEALRVGGHQPSLWSRANGSVNAITKVRVGSKVDTMRSRRNALPETYMEGAFTGPQAS